MQFSFSFCNQINKLPKSSRPFFFPSLFQNIKDISSSVKDEGYKEREHFHTLFQNNLLCSLAYMRDWLSKLPKNILSCMSRIVQVLFPLRLQWIEIGMPMIVYFYQANLSPLKQHPLYCKNIPPLQWHSLTYFKITHLYNCISSCFVEYYVLFAILNPNKELFVLVFWNE